MSDETVFSTTTLTLQQQLRMFVSVADRGRKWLRTHRGFEKTHDNRVTHNGRLVTFDELGTIAACVISARLVESGIKIVEVSDHQAELYARTDLAAIDPADWHQSYPVVLVKMPNGLLVAVTDMRDVVPFAAVHMLSFPLHTHMDHLWASQNFEDALVRALGNASSLTVATGRVAVNAVLHLANYGEHYGRYSSRHQAVKAVVPSEGLAQKKVELVPQIITLRHPGEAAEPQVSVHGSSEAIGTPKRPHWRRGHWRKVAIGAGRAERKAVWIKPLLVHAGQVAGDQRGLAVYRGQP